MKKTQMITILSTALLATVSTTGVLADEAVSDGTSSPATIQVTPSSEDTTAPGVVSPAEPSLPVPEKPAMPEKPADPAPENSGTKPSDSVVPLDPTSPSTEPEKTVEATPKPSTPSSEDNKKDEEKPKTEEKPDTKPAEEQPKTTDEANQTGKSQIGTISTATGQVVQDVTPSAPVQTNTGASIVSTQNGQLILGDGSTVAPETIGAVTNADKTITVTKTDGTKATLPHTGEASSILSVLGVALLGLVGLMTRKNGLNKK
ncbi:TPA: LPXTG cell wall anchor domain-containing protein [Streptococcus agalactiae]